MNEREATQLFHKLASELGLDTTIWSFRMDNSKQRFGACSQVRKRNLLLGTVMIVPGGRITLSKHLAALNTDHECEMTLRHEIAHALVGIRHGHDEVWRAMAIKCGDDGRRCYDSKVVVTPPGAFEAVCPSCGKVSKRTRAMKPGRQVSCGHCSGGRFNAAFQLAFKPTFIKPDAFVSPEVAKVLKMRAEGMGFVAIDRALGIEGKRGWVSWKIVKDHSK
jgi:predicted SprT family Zn-dependent metalloprotease